MNTLLRLHKMIMTKLLNILLIDSRVEYADMVFLQYKHCPAQLFSLLFPAIKLHPTTEQSLKMCICRAFSTLNNLYVNL